MQEILLVNCHLAGNVILTFEGLNLSQHLFLVQGNSIVDDTSNHVFIRLTHAENDFGLNKLDKALNQKLFHQLGVGVSVILDVFGHADLGICEESFNKLIS
jgi:hypothetical protein